MSFPNVIIVLIGGILAWWALGQLGIRPKDATLGF